MSAPPASSPHGRINIVEAAVDFLHMAFQGFVSHFKVTGNELHAAVCTFTLRVSIQLVKAGGRPDKIREGLSIMAEGFDESVLLLEARGELPLADSTKDGNGQDFGDFFQGHLLPKLPDSKN